MRRAARLDANQPEIVRALKAAGCSVQSLASLGDGVPDLLVGHHRLFGRLWVPCNTLLEVKDGSLPPSKRRLTDDEAAWHTRWIGEYDIERHCFQGGQVCVVENVEQAFTAIGVLPND